MKGVGLRRQQRQSQKQGSAQRSDTTVQVVFRTHNDTLSKAPFLFCPRNFNMTNPVTGSSSPSMSASVSISTTNTSAFQTSQYKPAEVLPETDSTATLVEAIVELCAFRDASGAITTASSAPGAWTLPMLGGMNSSPSGGSLLTSSTANANRQLPQVSSMDGFGSSGNLAGLGSYYYATATGSYVDLTALPQNSSITAGGGLCAELGGNNASFATNAASPLSPSTASPVSGSGAGSVGSAASPVGPSLYPIHPSGGWICRAMAFSEKETAHASGAISVSQSLTNKCPVINELAKGKTLARVISSYAEVQARYGLSHVELTFEHHYVSRSDMFLVSEALREAILYEGEEVFVCGFRFRVREMLRSVSTSAGAVVIGGTSRLSANGAPSSPINATAATGTLSGGTQSGASHHSSTNTTSPNRGGIPDFASATGTAATILARVVCGIVCPETRINFQSLSPVHYIVVELATEMWATTLDGRVALSWALKRFVRELVLQQLPKRKATPLIRVVFTGRLKQEFMLGRNTDVFHMLEVPREARDVDVTSEVDLHCEALVERVLREVREQAVVRLLEEFDGLHRLDRSTTSPQQQHQDSYNDIKIDAAACGEDGGEVSGRSGARGSDDYYYYYRSREFKDRLKAIRQLTAADIFVHSQQSNTLEALSIILERCDNHYIDRRLDTTGHNITILSAGKGLYQAINSVVQVNCARLHDVGIEKVYIVCVGRPPLHATPLLEYCTSDATLRSQYHIPQPDSSSSNRMPAFALSQALPSGTTPTMWRSKAEVGEEGYDLAAAAAAAAAAGGVEEGAEDSAQEQHYYYYYYESPEWAATLFYYPRLEVSSGEPTFELLTKEDWLRAQQQQQQQRPQPQCQDEAAVNSEAATIQRGGSSLMLGSTIGETVDYSGVEGPAAATSALGVVATVAAQGGGCTRTVQVPGTRLHGRTVLLPGLGLRDTPLPTFVYPATLRPTVPRRFITSGEWCQQSQSTSTTTHVLALSGDTNHHKAAAAMSSSITAVTTTTTTTALTATPAKAIAGRRLNGVEAYECGAVPVCLSRSQNHQTTSNPHSFVAGSFKRSLQALHDGTRARNGVADDATSSARHSNSVSCLSSDSLARTPFQRPFAASVPARAPLPPPLRRASDAGAVVAVPFPTIVAVLSAWYLRQEGGSGGGGNNKNKSAALPVAAARPKPLRRQKPRLAVSWDDRDWRHLSATWRDHAEDAVLSTNAFMQMREWREQERRESREEGQSSLHVLACSTRMDVTRHGFNIVDSVLRGGNLILELMLAPAAIAAGVRFNSCVSQEDALWATLLHCFAGRDDRLSTNVTPSGGGGSGGTGKNEAGQEDDEAFLSGFRPADIFARAECGVTADGTTLVLPTRSSSCSFRAPEELLFTCAAALLIMVRADAQHTGGESRGAGRQGESRNANAAIDDMKTMQQASAPEWEPALRRRMRQTPYAASAAPIASPQLTADSSATGTGDAAALAADPSVAAHSSSSPRVSLHPIVTTPFSVCSPTVSIGYVQLKNSLLFAISPVNPLISMAGNSGMLAFQGSSSIPETSAGAAICGGTTGGGAAPGGGGGGGGATSAENVSTSAVFQRRWSHRHPTNLGNCSPESAAWSRLCACRILPLYGCKTPYPRESFYAVSPHQYMVSGDDGAGGGGGRGRERGAITKDEGERCRLIEFVLQRLQQQYQIVVDGGPTMSYPMQWPRADPAPNVRVEMTIGHQTHTLKMTETAGALSVTRALHRGMYSNGQVTHMLSYRYALWNYLSDLFCEREIHLEAQVGETNGFCWEALDHSLQSRPTTCTPRSPDVWLRAREAAVVLLSEDPSKPVSFEDFARFIGYRFCAHLSTQGNMQWLPDMSDLRVDVSNEMPQELPRAPKLTEVVLARESPLTLETRSVVDHSTGRTILFDKPIAERFISLDIDLPRTYNPKCCYYLKVSWLWCDAATVTDWYGAFLANASRFHLRAIPVHCYYQNPKEESLSTHYDAIVPACDEAAARRRLLELLISSDFSYYPDTPVVNRHCRLVHRSGLCYVVVPPHPNVIAQWHQNTLVRLGTVQQRELLEEFQRALRIVRKELDISFGEGVEEDDEENSGHDEEEEEEAERDGSSDSADGSGGEGDGSEYGGEDENNENSDRGEL